MFYNLRTLSSVLQLLYGMNALAMPVDLNNDKGKQKDSEITKTNLAKKERSAKEWEKKAIKYKRVYGKVKKIV